METKVLTAHVPLPLAEKVDQMAARLERSRGWIVNDLPDSLADLSGAIRSLAACGYCNCGNEHKQQAVDGHS